MKSGTQKSETIFEDGQDDWFLVDNPKEKKIAPSTASILHSLEKKTESKPLPPKNVNDLKIQKPVLTEKLKSTGALKSNLQKMSDVSTQTDVVTPHEKMDVIIDIRESEKPEIAKVPEVIIDIKPESDDELSSLLKNADKKETNFFDSLDITRCFRDCFFSIRRVFDFGTKYGKESPRNALSP